MLCGQDQVFSNCEGTVYTTPCVCFGQTLKLDKFHVVAFASSSCITIKVTMNAPDRLDALAVPDDIPK